MVQFAQQRHAFGFGNVLRGQTAAMYAGLFKRVELLNDLSRKGADLNTEDAAGNSAARLVNGEIRMPVAR